MKTFLFSFAFIIVNLAQAKVNEADYSVPAPAELQEYANFKIQVNQAYGGDATQSLSYTFPAELTGQPQLVVNLTRVQGTKNDWESPEMDAKCNEDGEIFTCEIYLNKKPAVTNSMKLENVFSGNMVMQSSQTSELETFINKQKVVNFLTANAISPKALQGHLDVLDIFLSSEPAGILSYEFKPYSEK